MPSDIFMAIAGTPTVSITPEILTGITGVSSVIGLHSLLAYLYFENRMAEVRRSERSVRQIIQRGRAFQS